MQLKNPCWTQTQTKITRYQTKQTTAWLMSWISGEKTKQK